MSGESLNHHWCEGSLLPQAVLKHVVSRNFILKNSVHSTVLQYLAKNKEVCGIVSYLIFTLLLKGKFQHVGHKWVICGSYQIALWIMITLSTQIHHISDIFLFITNQTILTNGNNTLNISSY